MCGFRLYMALEAVTVGEVHVTDRLTCCMVHVMGHNESGWETQESTSSVVLTVLGGLEHVMV